MTGEKDLVCEFQYAKELYSKLACPEKKFYTFPEGLHEPHNDFEFEEWIQQILAWTDSKIKTYQPSQQCKLLF